MSKESDSFDRLTPNAESAAEAALQDDCEHEFEWITQPGTPDGPAEHFHVCKHCGMENNED